MKDTRQKNQRLAFLGLLTAITFIMIYTPLGTISIGPVSITIAHIPVLIATIMFGLKDGLIMGLIFGLTTVSKALISPMGILDPLFQNPLVSVLPRLMIPVVTYAVYTLLAKANKTLRSLAAIIFGNLANTLFVGLALYFIVGNQLEAIIGQDALTVVLSIVSAAAVPETIGVSLIALPIVLRIKTKFNN